MAPKKQSSKKPEEEGLQAIVMTDSYQNRFMPLTLETPRCLLPLANTPLIEYTLEFLATAGVTEVYVIGSSHADQIEGYLGSSKWVNASSPFKIEVIKSPDSQSIGDAMRDLDRQGLITSDFLLISGDIVSNIDFHQVLQAHRERKAKDKNSIMTMVLREASAQHRTRARSGAGLFVIDVPSGQCLRYEDAPNANRRLASFDIDYEVLSQHDTISLRNDLIDCHIDICAPDVPALFTENFDYNDIRKDFVRGILTSELLGKTIYTHIIDKHYSARVESYQTYDAVSKDIISRYSYPITPEYNIMEDQAYHYHHGHIYKEDGVVLSQSCIIRPQSVIGKESFIGEGTVVARSVIGRRCKIGKNVVLDNSYIWDDAVIGDNAVVRQSVVATKAVVESGAVVEDGSVVSFGVVVEAGTKISGKKLTLKKKEESDSESEDEEEVKEYYDTEESDVSDEDLEHTRLMHSLVYKMSQANMSDSSIASDNGRAHKKSRGKEEEHEEEYYDEEEEDFRTEAIASIERSISENHDVDIAALELNTLRMTLNVPYHEVREATVAAFVEYVNKLVSTGTLKLKAATEKIFGAPWGMLFKRQAFDDADREDLLQLLQEASSRVDQGGSLMFYAVGQLYEEDIVLEENIYGWFDGAGSQRDESLVRVRDVVGKYVEWLRTADEESEEE